MYQTLNRLQSKIKLVFYPESILPKTFMKKWYIENKNAYISSTNIILICGAFVIFSTIFLADFPAHFEPITLFVFIRTAVTFLCLTPIIFAKKIKSIYWYKVPYFVVFSLFTLGQFILMYYEHRIPFFLAAVALCYSCYGMGLSVGFSVIATTILYFTLSPLIIDRFAEIGLPAHAGLIGIYLVVVGFVCSLRARVFKDVRIFLLNQQLESTLEQLKRAQMEIIQSSQLAEIGKMSASIAHEINSPLLGNKSAAETIKFIIDNGIFGEEEIAFLKKSIKQIIESNEFIKFIIHNVQNSAGNPDSSATIESIKDVVDIALGVTGYCFKGKVKVEIVVSPDLKAYVQKVRAIRCIINLITNAVYAIEKAKMKDTKYPQIKIWSEAKNNLVQLIIQDNGPGLPKEIQENIFKPFNTNKPVGEGNGLGLSMVKDMMEKMGGQVDFRTSDQGTEFILSFPEKDPSL